MDYPDIIAYLNNSCTPLERKAVEEWLAQSEANQLLFQKTKKLWKQSLENPTEAPDTSKAWEAVSKLTLNRKLRPLSIIYRIAAAVLVLVIAYGIWTFNTATKWQITQRGEDDSLEKIELVDGTTVWLNENTILNYPLTFKGGERRVKISGEAYFEVAENQHKPFIIEANDLEVKVLGTAFNLMAHPDSLNHSLYVTSGRVAFYEKGKESVGLILEKNESASFNTENKQISTQPYQSYALAWKTGSLVFENTPLKIVASTLSKQFKIQFKFQNPALKDCELTAKFEQESLEEIIKMLEFLFNINANIKNNLITLEGAGC